MYKIDKKLWLQTAHTMKWKHTSAHKHTHMQNNKFYHEGRADQASLYKCVLLQMCVCVWEGG